jgi:hypothetical protein
MNALGVLKPLAMENSGDLDPSILLTGPVIHLDALCRSLTVKVLLIAYASDS